VRNHVEPLPVGGPGGSLVAVLLVTHRVAGRPAGRRTGDAQIHPTMVSTVGSGGTTTTTAVAPTAHGWWRGGGAMGSATGWCHRRSFTSAPELRARRGVRPLAHRPGGVGECPRWRAQRRCSSAQGGRCWPSSVVACNPEPGARTHGSGGTESVLSTSPPGAWWRGT
jgi:hypothetical protein